MSNLRTLEFHRNPVCKKSLFLFQWRGIQSRNPQKSSISPRRRLKNAPRINELGIQMLSQPLYEHLFKDKLDSKVYSKADAKRSLEHLRSHNLLGHSKKVKLLPEVAVKLPKLLSSSLEKHFQKIAMVQSQTYLDFALTLSRSPIPRKPNKWSQQTGWTRYDPATGKGKKVSHPMEDALIFDVETCVTDHQRPVFAVALTTKAWYVWVSKRLFSHQARFEEEEASLDDLIPLESEGSRAESIDHRSRLVVGHHVSFDRSKIKEQYFMGVSGRVLVCVLYGYWTPNTCFLSQ